MKYFLLLVTGFMVISSNIKAQERQHKIIFDVSSSDTNAQSAAIRQVNNVLESSPKTSIEVVFHGKAVYALVRDKTTFKEQIDGLVKEKNVVIAACNNSLTRLKVSKDDLIESAIIVPLAILELTDKQEKGWSYIKAGQ